MKQPERKEEITYRKWKKKKDMTHELQLSHYIAETGRYLQN